MSTRRLAVIGNPIGHSLSPLMHQGWIADHGIDASYEAKLFDGDDAAFVDWARTRPYDGANVTVPFKSAAWAAADDRCAGDVANVLTWSDGLMRADNTDGAGFLAALDEAAPSWRARVKRVLILGAGGGATGIARALQGEGIALTIANRTRARADALAASLANARAADWADLQTLFAEADLIVQTTTLGMSGGESPAWPVERCKPGAIIVDIVYRPLETPLLRAARVRGLVAIDGLGMLIHQGALAFEIWFGVKPDVRKARARLLVALGEGG